MSTIPLARPQLSDDEVTAVTRVLRSGRLTQGPEVEAFEAEFSDVVAGRACLAVNSGTSALQLALMGLGIGPDDEVLVPAFTFAATANAVVLAGAEPVFIDIDPVTYCMDPAATAAAVTPRTSAMIPVHLYGHPADTDALVAVARRHGLAVIEDAAQAHGAWSGDRPVGSIGDAAAFSFYPTKNMTSGEGGMVTAADAAVADRIRLLRNNGMQARYVHDSVGFNMRLDELAAAIGRVQLPKLAGWVEQRGRNAARLSAALGEIDHLVVPSIAPGTRHAFNQYTIRVADRDRVAADLATRGVTTAVYYPTPLHRLPPFARWSRDELAASKAASREVLSLPVHPGLSPTELDHVIDATRDVAGNAERSPLAVTMEVSS